MATWATILISAFVAFVGLLQYLTAYNKFRLDLYDRRLRVFDDTWNFVEAIHMVVVELPCKMDRKSEEFLQIQRAFAKSRHEASFLFEEDSGITAELDKIWGDGFKFIHFAESPETFERDLVDVQLLTMGLETNIQSLRGMLRPYLGFDRSYLPASIRGTLNTLLGRQYR